MSLSRLFFFCSLILLVCAAPICNSALDVVLVIDSSSSVVPYWSHIQAFMKSAFQTFAVSPTGVHLSIIQLSSYTQHEVCLTGTRCVLSSVVDNIKPLTGLTEFYDGFRAAQLELQTNSRFEYGKTENQVIIIVTDGEEEVASYKEITDELKRNDVQIFAIGVGTGQDGNALREMSTSESHYFSVNEYKDLVTILPAIADPLCDSWIFPANLCGQTLWLVGLALVSQSALLYLSYLYNPQRSTQLKSLQFVCLSTSLGLLVVLLISSFVIVNLLCVLQIILSVSIVLLSCYIYYTSIHPLIKKQYNRGSTSRAAESVLASGGGTPASMMAFRMEKSKVINPTVVSGNHAVSGYSKDSDDFIRNPLSRAARSL
ncbi:hypothetical protein GEMRC1_014140 [Eukaryota sp. GEM-RC1]